MVVMADEVWNVLAGHDALYRRGPEQNARQEHDTGREVGRTESGERRFVPSSLRIERTPRLIGERRIAAVIAQTARCRYRWHGWRTESP